MPDLYVSWEEYHAKIEQLAAKIYQSNWEFDQILCLARGGLRIGDILSRIYNKPLAILSVASYGGKDFQERGDLAIAQSITMTTTMLGKRVLLVDDLVDSGLTLTCILEWLKQNEKYAITEVRSAVLWFKAGSGIAPDYYVDFVSDSSWIHQPFEKYEKLNLTDL